MTCVVGVVGRKGVLLAGDSQVSWDNAKRMDKEPKVFQLSDVLAIAYCGSGRLGQLLTYHMEALEDPPLGRDEHRWAVREFIPFLRGVAEEQGHLHIRHNVEHIGESAFFLAVRGRLFGVWDDLGVTEHRQSYDAMGSGSEVAIGAMRSAAGAEAEEPRTDASLERIALAGVESASAFTNFVGGEISMVKTVVVTDEERELCKRIAKHGS